MIAIAGEIPKVTHLSSCMHYVNDSLHTYGSPISMGSPVQLTTANSTLATNEVINVPCVDISDVIW